MFGHKLATLTLASYSGPIEATRELVGRRAGGAAASLLRAPRLGSRNAARGGRVDLGGCLILLSHDGILCCCGMLRSVVGSIQCILTPDVRIRPVTIVYKETKSFRGDVVQYRKYAIIVDRTPVMCLGNVLCNASASVSAGRVVHIKTQLNTRKQPGLNRVENRVENRVV